MRTTWAKSGMTVKELAEEYINKRKSLSQICKERGICKGSAGMGGVSMALQMAGYTIRNRAVESAEKRKITRENMQERLGISWEELVGWYKERKPMSGLCAKYGLGSQRTVIFKRLLFDGGIINNDPLRGYGFTEEELVKMYVDDGMSMQQIYDKFNLGRAAERVVSSVLRKLGVHRWDEDCFHSKGNQEENNGRYISSDGYIRVYINPDNMNLTNIPLGHHDVEHRLVVAESIGRPLKSEEFVHHINWNKSDNRLSNLMLVDQDNHRKIHISMNKVIEALFKEGKVVLNKNNEYELKESSKSE